MGRWLLLVSCSLVLLGAVTQFGPTRSPGARSLGGTCASDRDCQTGLSCAFESGVIEGQCAAPCNATESCQDRFGSLSMCLGADLCAHTCNAAGDCPTQTTCNAYGWCES